MVEDAKRVLGPVSNRRVPGDGRHAEQLDGRAERREHDRDRVVRTGVDIENHLVIFGLLRLAGCASR
ncbi:MAG TPA: hypothetical protein VMV08_04590 [Gaiellaceae bacterium]|nr:hypothetical protein [Gaiellaceae bacterium]